jgi:1,2-diacylglycerol-3-alpha-glucose alpha-1,2-glucosyltransferase
MKICLYLEYYHFLGGRIYKKIGTGLLSSYKNQKKILAALDIPYVETWDDSCDILQINTPWLKSIYLIKKARRKGKKIIIWSHVTVEDSMQVFRFMPLIAPLVKKYLTFAYGLADIIFAPTEYTKSLLVAYGIPANKIVAQSNAVNLEKYFRDEKIRATNRKKYDLNTVTVGSMALVIPRKGLDTFLSLAKIFNENQFIWFGKIYSSLIVKPLPKELPENVSFKGHTDAVNEAYNAMDVFIFPSYEENEGMAILEAAAASLPILVRDIPVYEGWLIHEKNCLKAKNEAEFEKYLKTLIEDEKLRIRLGQAARKLAEDKSIPVVSQKALSVYKKLLEE